MVTMTAPKISVVLPVYNARQHIKEAVDSILNQTFQDFEIILINDGSTDDSLQIMHKNYADNKKVSIINQQNHGLIFTLNKGISLAKGELIARMDADDIAFPERFRKQVELFNLDPELILCSASIKNFGAENNNTFYSSDNDELKAFLLFRPPFSHPAAMFKRTAFTEHHIEYDESYKHCEDFALWSVLANFGNFSNVTDIMLNYRVHENQVTNTFPETVLNAHYRICQKNLAALKVGFAKQDFLSYLAKERHPKGFNAVLTIYQRVGNANKTVERYNQEALERVLAQLISSQIENFYGLKGLLLARKQYSLVPKQFNSFTLLIKALRRDIIRLVK